VKQMAMALLLVIGASALACGEKKTTGGASDSGPAGPRVAKFRIGSAATSDGIVTIETDSFRQGDTVYISFEEKNVPSQSRAKVVWSDASKRKISEEQKPLESGSGAVKFQLKGTADLAIGDYLLELYYGDPGPPEKWSWLGSKSLRVGPKSP
jgi:hypothetical protein